MPLAPLAKAVLAALAILLACLAPTAVAHDGADHSGLSERELRSYETFVLGSEHARDHARSRAERRAAERPSPQLDTPAGQPTAAAGADGDGAWLHPLEVIGAARSPFKDRLSVGVLGTPTGAYAPEDQPLVDDPREQDGDWSAPFELPLYAIHAALLPTGKVLWFGPPDPGFGSAATTWNTTWAVLWDPISGDLERVDPPLWQDPSDGQFKPANIYCAGQAFLASGELLIAGGTLGRTPANEPLGLNKVYTFDPFATDGNYWVEQPEMEHGRWYPTNVQWPDGRQAIMSGSDEFGATEDFYNETIEVFEPGAERGAQGTLTTLVDANGDPAERGTAGQPPTGGLYPHMFAMPSGKTLVAGPFQTDTWYLNVPSANDRLTWSQADNLDWRRRYATGVIAPPSPGDTSPPSKVMVLGGYGSTGDPETHQKSLKTTEIFDDANPGAGWSYDSEMNVGRSNQNTVLLPDGSMVQVGGGVGADLYGTVPDHRKVELWDPQTREWRFGAEQAEDRAYHSTAVLLPDGRVVSAGDDGNPDRATMGPEDPLDTAEVYSPPYLFKGPRPTISYAPDTVELGDAFDVETPDDIDRAALIAPGATTHANDMHQRYVPLDVVEEADGVQLTPPASANAAPPGYYMLFIVDEAGVPSIAKFVQVVPDKPDGEITIVKQTTPSGAPDSFTFSGDLGPFSLAGGQSKTVSVPAGRHDVAEAAQTGWNSTSVSCSDGSTTDLVARRARIDVSPGESVTCTFASVKPADPDPDPDPNPDPDPGTDTTTTPVPPPATDTVTTPASPGPKLPVALTQAQATDFARATIAKRLGDGSAKSRRAVKPSCKPARGGFQCAFTLGAAYRGTLVVRDTAGRPAAGALTFTASCGNLRGGPSALKTKNLACPVARRSVTRWLAGGAPPRGYRCGVRPAPQRTSCRAGAKSFSFRARAGARAPSA